MAKQKKVYTPYVRYSIEAEREDGRLSDLTPNDFTLLFKGFERFCLEKRTDFIDRTYSIGFFGRLCNMTEGEAAESLHRLSVFGLIEIGSLGILVLDLFGQDPGKNCKLPKYSAMKSMQPSGKSVNPPGTVVDNSVDNTPPNQTIVQQSSDDRGTIVEQSSDDCQTIVPPSTKVLPNQRNQTKPSTPSTESTAKPSTAVATASESGMGKGDTSGSAGGSGASAAGVVVLEWLYGSGNRPTDEDRSQIAKIAKSYAKLLGEFSAGAHDLVALRYLEMTLRKLAVFERARGEPWAIWAVLLHLRNTKNPCGALVSMLTCPQYSLGEMRIEAAKKFCNAGAVRG